MSPTKTYTKIAVALATAGAEVSLTTFETRVLLAVADRAGVATSLQIISDLKCDGSVVRRSLGTLYDRELAIGEGSDGGVRRPGVVTMIRLTPAGQRLTERVRELIGGRRR